MNLVRSVLMWGALEQLGNIMFDPDDKGRDRLNETYQKVISLPSRVKSLKDLSDSLKTLIGLEREAWSIGTTSEPEKNASTRKKILI